LSAFFGVGAQQVREEELALATLARQVEEAKREAAALSAGARTRTPLSVAQRRKALAACV
jgi:hypothetical protein